MFSSIIVLLVLVCRWFSFRLVLFLFRLSLSFTTNFLLSFIIYFFTNRKCCNHTFKAPCLVTLNMHLTLHLLLFKQSMLVLIAIGIRCLTSLWRDICSIENQDNKLLGLCFVFKIIVCKDDVFLALQLQIMNENLKFCTMMYRTAMPNGIIVATIKHFSFPLQQPILIGWD